MPTYVYRCKKCKHRFELFHGMSDESVRRCPKCKARAERVPAGGAGILFKGSGFYITDYRSKAYKEKAKKESSAESTPAPAAPATPAPPASGSGSSGGRPSGSGSSGGRPSGSGSSGGGPSGGSAPAGGTLTDGMATSLTRSLVEAHLAESGARQRAGSRPAPRRGSSSIRS